MNLKLFLLTVCIVILSCKDDIITVADPAYKISGIVSDARSGTFLDSVLVGFAQDTSLFKFDNYFSERCPQCTYSDEGNFHFFWLGTSPPLPYENMFAFKPGYILWRYDEKRDEIKRYGTYRDSIYIELVKQ